MTKDEYIKTLEKNIHWCESDGGCRAYKTIVDSLEIVDQRDEKIEILSQKLTGAEAELFNLRLENTRMKKVIGELHMSLEKIEDINQ